MGLTYGGYRRDFDGDMGFEIKKTTVLIAVGGEERRGSYEKHLFSDVWGKKTTLFTLLTK